MSLNSYETNKLPIIDSDLINERILSVRETINKLREKEKLSLVELKGIQDAIEGLTTEDYGFTLVTRNNFIREFNVILAKGVLDQADSKTNNNERKIKLSLVERLNQSIIDRKKNLLKNLRILSIDKNKFDNKFYEECQYHKKIFLKYLAEEGVSDTDYCNNLSELIQLIDILSTYRKL